MWNVHNRVINHLGRTNNYAEAAHRRVQLELKTDHPTIWKLFFFMQITPYKASEATVV